MSQYWVMEASTLQEYMIGKVEFLKMGAEKRQVYIDSVRREKRNFGLSSLDKIFSDPNSIKVGIKDKTFHGIDKETYSKIEKEVGSETVNKIKSVFDSEDDEDGVEILYVISNGVAHIPVVGVLRRGREIDSLYNKWSYNSTYNEITVGSEMADLDPRVKNLSYEHNSPGGDVDGSDMAGKAIKAVKKPTVARNHNIMMSGSLWLGSQADVVTAVSETSRQGSLGVAYEWYDWSKWEKDIGIVLKSITSKNAPDKRPTGARLDKLLKKSADDLEAIFIDRVAVGRGKTPEYVAKNFGRGWELLASDALSAGMIDSIEGKINSDVNINETGEDIMNVKDFKSEYPSIYNDVFSQGKDEGISEGAASGKKAEAERTQDHLGWTGKASQETILKNIKDGKVCDNTCFIAYSDERVKLEANKKRIEDDDGHQAPENDDPSAKGAEGAGMKDKKNTMVDSKMLEAELKSKGMM